MRSAEAIRWVDEKKHNVFTLADKLLWLNTVEKQVGQLRERCGLEPGIGEVTADCALSVPAPYDVLYLRWLEAQIHYTNQEYIKYNNAMAMFSAAWQSYADYLRRGAAPVGRRKFF